MAAPNNGEQEEYRARLRSSTGAPGTTLASSVTTTAIHTPTQFVTAGQATPVHVTTATVGSRLGSDTISSPAMQRPISTSQPSAGGAAGAQASTGGIEQMLLLIQQQNKADNAALQIELAKIAADSRLRELEAREREQAARERESEMEATFRIELQKLQNTNVELQAEVKKSIVNDTRDIVERSVAIEHSQIADLLA